MSAVRPTCGSSRATATTSIAFLRAAARGRARLLVGPRQQPAGARRRHPRRRDLRPTAPWRRLERRGATGVLAESRRALRAHRPAVRQMEPGAGRVLRRHSRHAGRCAGDECRRLRRRDLAARASKSRCSIDRRVERRRAAAASTAMAIGSVSPPAPNEWFLAATLAFELRAGRFACSRCRHCWRVARRRQPIGEWSCGSVFTNPPGDHAARLIEAAGLKGFQVGGAVVSDKHANFIAQHRRGDRARYRAVGSACPGDRALAVSVCSLHAGIPDRRGGELTPCD